jgi:hypothetical protein
MRTEMEFFRRRRKKLHAQPWSPRKPNIIRVVTEWKGIPVILMRGLLREKGLGVTTVRPKMRTRWAGFRFLLRFWKSLMRTGMGP